MLEQDSNVGRESPRGSHAVAATGGEPSTGLEEWWKTPASLAPPPPNPAIYGLDAHEVGAAPNVNAHIGTSMSNGASTQVAGPSKTRADHMRSAEGARSETMSDQLMLAARKIEVTTAKIITMLDRPLGARSADGVLAHLETLVAEAVGQRDRIMLVAHEQQRASLKVAPDTEGLMQVDRASHQLNDAIRRVKAFATTHNLPLDAKKVPERGVQDYVDRAASAYKTDVASAKLDKIEGSDDALQLAPLDHSLDALVEGTLALSMAVNEPSPEEKIKEVLPSLLSTTRLFQASVVDGLRPNPSMLNKAARVKMSIEKAWRDGAPFNLQNDTAFRSAHTDILATISTLEKLGKKTKK